MNPGLVVKLRPAGPWRIGPDSGARNRVDVIYHSDSLYRAVTSAMSRMGSLDAWLDATARSADAGGVFQLVLSRSWTRSVSWFRRVRVWPPTSPAAMSARVRWKSARFIPLSMVESILAGKRWTRISGAWMAPAAAWCRPEAGTVPHERALERRGRPVERRERAALHGVHRISAGCGLWTVVGFRDEAARDAWQEPVKAAFRLLADTGFGGERSRGWGRSETPEFVEGTLPGLIIEYKPKASSPASRRGPETEDQPPVTEPPVDDPGARRYLRSRKGLAAEVAAALEAAMEAAREALPVPDDAADDIAAPPEEPTPSGESEPADDAVVVADDAAVGVEDAAPVADDAAVADDAVVVADDATVGADDAVPVAGDEVSVADDAVSVPDDAVVVADDAAVVADDAVGVDEAALGSRPTC